MAFMMIFILPIDLLSQHEERNLPFGFNFDMATIWTFIAMIVLILFFLNNLLITYYRMVEAKTFWKRLWKSCKIHIITIIIYCLVALIIN